MTTNETSGQESDGRTDLEVTVCENGVVNVHRPESDRAHSVFVGESGDVLRCSCKGHHYRGHCSHADAIAARPLVTASARATAAAGQRVATDGGRVESAESDDDGRERPTRSEHADFGGGEASGMDKLGDFDDGDDTPETCDHCGEPPELTVTDVSGSDWNDYEQLCTTCVLDVGGPGEAPDGHNADGDETETEASGGSMTRTATGWASSDTSVPVDEDETVDETPL